MKDYKVVKISKEVSDNLDILCRMKNIYKYKFINDSIVNNNEYKDMFGE